MTSSYSNIIYKHRIVQASIICSWDLKYKNMCTHESHPGALIRRSAINTELCKQPSYVAGSSNTCTKHVYLRGHPGALISAVSQNNCLDPLFATALIG